MIKHIHDKLESNSCLQWEINWINSNPMRYQSRSQMNQVINNIEQRYYLREVEGYVKLLEDKLKKLEEK